MTVVKKEASNFQTNRDLSEQSLTDTLPKSNELTGKFS